MKLVINSEHGGFNLSDEAVELCISRGMPVRMAGEPRDGEIFFVELDDDIRAVARRRFAQNFVSGELEKVRAAHHIDLERELGILLSAR